MKFATLAMVIATAAAADKQCSAIGSLGTNETCLCDAAKANPGCLTKN